MAEPHTLTSRIVWSVWCLFTLVAFLVGMLAFAAGSASHVVVQGQLFQIDVRNFTQAATAKVIDPQAIDFVNITSFYDSVHHDAQDDRSAGRLDSTIGPASAQPPSDVDFYNAYLWNYCVGKYDSLDTDGWVKGGAFEFAYGITWCSPRNMVWGYNTITALQAGLPEQIRPDYAPTTSRFQALYTLYLIGLISGGITVFFAVLMVVKKMKAWKMIMLFAIATSFVGMLGGSIAATALLTEAANQWNGIGPTTGIAAYDGGLFLALTWSATTLYFLFEAILLFEWKRSKKAEAAAAASDAEEAVADAAFAQAEAKE